MRTESGNFREFFRAPTYEERRPVISNLVAYYGPPDHSKSPSIGAEIVTDTIYVITTLRKK